jgi:very-short-patch-repair endonuclease
MLREQIHYRAGEGMELRRIVWAWDTLVLRLADAEPELGRPLRRSCRPIAAERHLDGKLAVVLGCWWPADLAYLADPDVRERLDAAISPMLEDEIATEVVTWPAGMAAADGAADDLPAPPLLNGLPEAGREAAERCESALQRWFYAHAYARGLRLETQHVVEHYRLDFALPRYRVGAEVDGWEARHGPREREQQLGLHRWRVLWFGGKEVHANVERCVADLLRVLPREAVAATPRPPGRPGPSLTRLSDSRRPRPGRNGYRERR